MPHQRKLTAERSDKFLESSASFSVFMRPAKSEFGCLYRTHIGYTLTHRKRPPISWTFTLSQVLERWHNIIFWGHYVGEKGEKIYIYIYGLYPCLWQILASLLSLETVSCLEAVSRQFLVLIIWYIDYIWSCDLMSSSRSWGAQESRSPTTTAILLLHRRNPPSSGVCFSSLALRHHSRPVTTARIDTETSYTHNFHFHPWPSI